MEKARSWKETIVIYCGFDCFRFILFINSSKELSNLLHLDMLPPKNQRLTNVIGERNNNMFPLLKLLGALVVILWKLIQVLCYVPSYVLPRDLWLITGFTASVKSETAATYGYATLENTSQHLMKKWLKNTKRFRNSKGVIKMIYLRCFVIISLKNSYGWNIDLSQDKNQQNVFPNGLCVSIYRISSGKFLCFLTTCTFYFIGNHQEIVIPLSLPVKNNCSKQAVTFYPFC